VCFLYLHFWVRYRFVGISSNLAGGCLESFRVAQFAILIVIGIASQETLCTVVRADREHLAAMSVAMMKIEGIERVTTPFQCCR